MRSLAKSFAEIHPEGYENETLARFIFERVAGLALPTAREIVLRAEKEKTPVWEFIGAFCENEPCRPCVRYEKGVPTDFFAFEIAGGAPAPSLCKAEDEFYSYRELKKGFEDEKRKVESAAKTLKKKAGKRLADTLEKLREAEKADENRIKGELLTANLYAIEKGATSVELVNWYDEEGGTVKISLDATLSPAKNAQKYFRLYNKQKRAKEILTPMKAQEQAEIAYADSILASIALADTGEDLKEIADELIEAGLLRAPKQRAGGKKKEQAAPFREFTHGGFKILAGRNNLQNDRLLKIAAPDDIWLHAQKYHSAFVLVVAEGKSVPDKTLLYAAQICAYYSEARESDKLPIDYCKRKFVKKPSKSKAGFVVYTDYKTLLVTPKISD